MTKIFCVSNQQLTIKHFGYAKLCNSYTIISVLDTVRSKDKYFEHKNVENSVCAFSHQVKKNKISNNSNSTNTLPNDDIGIDKRNNCFWLNKQNRINSRHAHEHTKYFFPIRTFIALMNVRNLFNTYKWSKSNMLSVILPRGLIPF